MKHLQKGFTLIELIVVIVILGILSAVALPKFIDFKSDAASSAAAGIAGALSSASALNYAATAAGKSPVTWSPTHLYSSVSSTTCNGAFGMLTATPDSTKYSIATTTGSCASSADSGSILTCTVTYSSGGTTQTAQAPLTCY